MAVLGFALGQFGLEQEGIGAYEALTTCQTVKDFDSITCTTASEYRRCLKASLDSNEHNTSAINALDRIRRDAHAFSCAIGDDDGRNGGAGRWQLLRNWFGANGRGASLLHHIRSGGNHLSFEASARASHFQLHSGHRESGQCWRCSEYEFIHVRIGNLRNKRSS
ncbi:hypothetical protein ASF01_03030 [Stenotrophomonas sp. Leaf70]|nr:hypothetical protein ASF01_03030 [Stenotrophomonas sp. Leaf70]